MLLCVEPVGREGATKEGDRQGTHTGWLLKQHNLEFSWTKEGSNLIASGPSRFQSNETQIRE